MPSRGRHSGKVKYADFRRPLSELCALAVAAHIAEVRQTVDQVQELGDHARQMEKTLRHSMQWLGMVRFNPFRDTGGNQSFAIALVDGHGNGVVISSLHARDGTRVYAKPLRHWESTYTLTDEEKEAIARAYQQQG